MSNQPDHDAAIAFLRQWDPDGWWVLTAITVDRKSIITSTFTEATCHTHLLPFLKEHSGTRNLYFHVNPVLAPLEKKAERQDIQSVAWFHVDIDPRVGEDLARERERALHLLQHPPGTIPLPTVIIFSGGGYQGFWKLQTPIPINGDLVLAEDSKHYNIQLEMMFGADNCHNIDRIMRLPGSINLPDARKRRKGRLKTLAQLVEFHNDRVYELTQFTRAQIAQGSENGFTTTGASHIHVRTAVPHLQSIDELPPEVGEETRALIAQGTDPNEPAKYPSRSEALFAACCALIRSNVQDDMIFAVITNPIFQISASVLDKGNGAERYAIRQIERAHEEAIHPKLRELNTKHAVISDIGGRCRVISEVPDPVMNRPRLSQQSFEDFRNRYMNKKIKVGEDKHGHDICIPMGKWWLEHALRRQFDTMVFAPGREVNGAFNLWRGFACEARPGECPLFLGHIKSILCQDNMEYFTYVLGWMAECVQHPDTPGQSAIVLRGKMGTGKSFFAKSFGSLFGRHFMAVGDPKHLVGSFNAHLRDTVVLFGDEAFFAGDKKHESILRMLITEELITVESKGVDVEAAPNFTHLILSSNSSWVVPAGGTERRFFVLDVSDTQKRQTGYFSKIQHELDHGGREALLHFLMTYDLNGFQVRTVPKTEALMEQKLLSLSLDEEWWYRKLNDGRLLLSHHYWVQDVPKDALMLDYVTYAQKLGNVRRSTETTLGKFLHRVCPHPYPRSFHQPREKGDTGARPHMYRFPTLQECRFMWDDQYEGPFPWVQHEDLPPLETTGGQGEMFA